MYGGVSQTQTFGQPRGHDIVNKCAAPADVAARPSSTTISPPPRRRDARQVHIDELHILARPPFKAIPDPGRRMLRRRAFSGAKAIPRRRRRRRRRRRADAFVPNTPNLRQRRRISSHRAPPPITRCQTNKRVPDHLSQRNIAVRHVPHKPAPRARGFDMQPVL